MVEFGYLPPVASAFGLRTIVREKLNKNCYLNNQEKGTNYFVELQCFKEWQQGCQKILLSSYIITLLMLRLLLSKTQGGKDFYKTSKPCHVDIH